MKKALLLISISLVFLGCTAKDTKTLGGQMMSASGSAGVAGLITFPIGGLVYLAGSSAEEDNNAIGNNIEQKSSPVFDVIENNSSITRDLHHSATSDNNNTEVFSKPYELLSITASDVKKENDNNETQQMDANSSL